jgi:hypothetical protein
MKITIELCRSGSSRVSEEAIPLQAYVVMGGQRGINLLPNDRFSDIEYAKKVIKGRLEHKQGAGLEINWVDRTKE